MSGWAAYNMLKSHVPLRELWGLQNLWTVIRHYNYLQDNKLDRKNTMPLINTVKLDGAGPSGPPISESTLALGLGGTSGPRPMCKRDDPPPSAGQRQCDAPWLTLRWYARRYKVFVSERVPVCVPLPEV